VLFSSRTGTVIAVCDYGPVSTALSRLDRLSPASDVGDARDVQLLVIEASASLGAADILRVHAMATNAVQTVIVWRRGPAGLAKLHAWLKASARNVIVVHDGHDLYRQLANAVCNAPRLPAGQLVRAMADRLSGLPTALTAAIALSDYCVGIDVLSAAVGLVPGSLRRSLRIAGLPTPTALISWTRAMNVVAGLAESAVDLHDLLLCGGDGSEKRFSERMRHHTGKTPRQWLAEGGHPAIADAFCKRLGRRLIATRPIASNVRSPQAASIHV
jgi:hypothetical protein